MAEIESYYPDVLKKVREFKVLATVENPEMELIYNTIDEVLDQQFIETATTYGVTRLEKILGISPKVTDTIEERKLKVLSKYNEDKPYTVTKLKELLSTLCGTDGYSLEISNGKFTLKVKVALTSKKNKEAVVELMERIVPVNMVISVELMYNQWHTARGLTWGGVSGIKWEELREEVISVG